MQISELIKISTYAGMREDLIQVGGGNTSFKQDEKKMAIKASGVQLADMTEDFGYSTVDYPVIREYLEDLAKGKDVVSANEILADALICGNRPSIETFLHASMDTLTMHTHPTVITAISVRENGMQILQKIWPEAMLIGYATPGLDLANEFFKAYKLYVEKFSCTPKVAFLKNHGLVISGKTADEVIELNEQVMQKAEEYSQVDYKKYKRSFTLHKALCEIDVQENIVLLTQNETIKKAYAEFGGIWDFQFSPDCVVFLGKKEMSIQDDDIKKSFSEFIPKNGIPVIIEWDAEIYVRAKNITKARETECMLAYTAKIALLNHGQASDLISEQEQNFLLNWDAEKYRRNI